MIIIVSGLPGSGKSFFASRLANMLDAAYVSSDLTSKDKDALDKYSDFDKMAIYLTMADLTREKIRLGKNVVVDAIFHHHSLRDFFKELAQELHVPIYFILIETTEDIAKKRLSERKDDIETDYGLYISMKAKFEKYNFPHLTIQSADSNIEDMLSLATSYISAIHE